jgi:hypothetical protein
LDGDGIVSGVDTWDKLIQLPNVDYRFLVILVPGEYLECGSDWTSGGGNTHAHDLIEEKVDAVTDDGVELTLRADLSTLQAAAEGYYFDLFNQRIYVKAIDRDDLSSGSTDVIIVCYVRKYFATDTCEFEGHQYKPLVMQNSLPNMDLSVDDIVEGIYKFNFGSFTMINDGWFDKASDDYIWLNRLVYVKIGGESLPFSEYQLYFVGRISDMHIRDHEVSFSVKDIRVGTFSQIPIDHYWLEDHINLMPEEGDPVPIFYGEKTWIVPTCVNPYNHTGLRAVAGDGGSLTTESTEAHDLTEDDMTLLPASPTTADNYYFGHTTNKFGKIHLLIGQKGVGTWEGRWMYWNGTAWGNLANKHDLSDGTNNFRPEEDDEWYTISWKIPNNWATTSVNGINGYWIRYDVTSFSSMSQQPLGTRCKLDATKGSVWKIAGHEINAILKVQKNKVYTTSFTSDLVNGQYTFDDYFDTEQDEMRVSAQGKKVSAVYITKGASIAKDILKSYLGFLDIELDLPSFTTTDTNRTHPICIHLDTEESSREVLQTIGRSIVAFFSPTENGKLSFEAYEPTVEPGTLELFDPDYWSDWKVTKDDKFVKNKVEIQYDQNPQSQEYKIVVRNNYDVLYKYGIRETLSLKTYIKNKADAETVTEGIRDMCSKPITVVETSFGVKGFMLFPTRKVKLTRERAADSSGAFDAKVFRIRTVSKDTSSEKTHIVAMDDLQTLGESFCYVCYSCQNCVEEQASCELCYTCEICNAAQGGCQSCVACEICVSDEGGCQTCVVCYSCIACQVNAGECQECQNCDSCQDCVTCETTVNTCVVCQVCYGCDHCDTCEAYYSCVSCDVCQTCVSGCQDCEVCDVCVACQTQDSCSSCDSCQVHYDCYSCYTQQECAVCAVCDDCENCNTCQSNVSCVTCNTCQVCVVGCEDCQSCDVCNLCQSNISCVKCNSCQTCVNCQACVTICQTSAP